MVGGAVYVHVIAVVCPVTNDSDDDEGVVAPVHAMPIVTPERSTADWGVNERVGDSSFTASVDGNATTLKAEVATIFIDVPPVGVL